MSQRKTSANLKTRKHLLLAVLAVTCSCLSGGLVFAQAQNQKPAFQNAGSISTSSNSVSTPITNAAVPQVQSGPVVPATSRQQALFDAKRAAGRSDPLAPIEGFKPFPTGSVGLFETKHADKDKSLSTQIPAPPSVAGMKLIPPPPPVVNADELSVSELPLPPDRPSLAAKLRLTGVIGDKAIFVFTDKEAARLNKWPGILLMGPGDRFESVETVSVGTDSVVLEEDGERSTKSLERIR